MAKVQQNKGDKKASKNDTFLTNQRLHLVLISLLSVLLYANTLGHDYTWDDAILITENDYTKSADFKNIFTKDTFHGFFKTQKNLVAGGRYRPLTQAMFSLEYQLSKKPFIGHLMNVFWYALTSIVLYLVLLKMFNPRKDKTKFQAWFFALTTTLIFVVHPIHTEAVANIKGRDEIITLLAALSALYCTLQAYYTQQKKWLFGAGAVFFLGLLAKENAITFLAVIPLTFYVFTDAKPLQIIKNTIPIIIATIVFLALRFSILGFPEAIENPDLLNDPFRKLVGNTWVDFSLNEWLATIIFTLGKYLQLLVAPLTLTHDYYPRHIDIMHLTDWRVLASLLAYVSMGAYALIRLPKRSTAAYGILFFLLTLSIVSNIVFPIGTNMSERFMFMPSVGFALFFVVFFWKMTILFKKKSNLLLSDLKGITAIFSIIILLFSIKTIHRNTAWKDNFTLFSTDIQTSKNSVKLLNAMGGELTTRAILPENSDQKQAMLTQAADYLKKAISIHPTYANAYLLLGNCHNYMEQYDTAIQYYEQAMTYKNDYKEAINNEAITYREAALNDLEKKQNLDKIPSYLDKSLKGLQYIQKKHPNYAEVDKNIAVTQRVYGRYLGEIKQAPNEALILLNQALSYNPNDEETLRLMSLCYGISGQHDKMITTLQKLIEQSPNNAILYLNMSSAYYQKGDITNAEAYRQKALKINPKLGQ